MQYSNILKNTIDNPASVLLLWTIVMQMGMDNNMHIIRQIVHAILFLGKQGLPLRGVIEISAQQKI